MLATDFLDQSNIYTVKQLSLFPVEDRYFLGSVHGSDAAVANKNVSLPEPSSDASSHTDKGFQDNLVWVNKYSPGRRVTKYYRLSYNWEGKKKHRHISGGNVNLSVATTRAEQLRAMINRGASIQELLRILGNM